MKWINYISRHFPWRVLWAEEGAPGHLPPRGLKAVIEMIDKTREDELTCEQVHALLGAYVELKGRERAVEMPLVAEHLCLCRECLEEYQALARILEGKQQN